MSALHAVRPLIAPERRGPVIGSRWSPEHAIKRDRASGVYEERNPLANPDDPSITELRLQRALLPRAKGWFTTSLKG